MNISLVGQMWWYYSCIEIRLVVFPLNENQENVNQNVSPQPEVYLETLKLMYDLAKSEYDAEIERFGSFEIRTGIMFALTGAMAPILAKLFIMPENKYSLLFNIVLVLLEIASIVSMATAGVFFFLVLRVKPVERIHLKEWASEKYVYKTENDFLLALIATYRDATLTTRKSTEERVNSFQRGLAFSGLSLAFALITSLLVIIVTGKG